MSGEVHVLYNASPATLTDGAQAQLQADATGALKVAGAGTGGSPVGGVFTVQSPALSTTTVTITSGQSLSGVANLGNGVLVGILIPAAWTAAAVTFAVGFDGVTTYPFVDGVLGEYTVASANVAVSTIIGIPYGELMAGRYVAVRSGTSSSAVAQGGDRIVTLIYRT